MSDDTTGLVEMVARSSWEASIISCIIGTAIVNAIKCQPSVDAETFVGDVIGNLLVFAEGVDSTMAREAIMSMVETLSKSHADMGTTTTPADT